MNLKPAGPNVASTEFAGFAQLIEDACGVHYKPEDHPVLDSKVESHARALGFCDVRAYYNRLRHDDPAGVELERLVEAVLVHETYFFRELAPLVQLVDGHLGDVIRERGRARVWSAACATGEEPLTLAMLLDDRGLLDRVEIVASDVSAAAIARAKAGRYGTRALRDGHPRELAERYLTREVSMVPRIHARIEFKTLNLLDDEGVRRLGLFDVILCRNVLMYFREDKVAGVVERIVRSLEPDGLIAVGIAESLLRYGPALACEERGGSFFYRRAR